MSGFSTARDLKFISVSALGCSTQGGRMGVREVVGGRGGGGGGGAVGLGTNGGYES